MTQGERVRAVRKSLGLTLEKLGIRLGVSKTAISNIENGSRNLTEQMKKSICREFYVDYKWLTTGEGEMFLDNDENCIARIVQIMSDEKDFRKKLFNFFLDLDNDELKVMERIVSKAVNSLKES